MEPRQTISNPTFAPTSEHIRQRHHRSQRHALWRRRLTETNCEVADIDLPGEETVSQDREWCLVHFDNGEKRRIRFHDYDEIYEIPGLYEKLFYENLSCNSPWRVADLLVDTCSEYDINLHDLRVLDVGAGNGMVGDELVQRGVRHVVGIDIYDEARDATMRDRQGIYRDYHVVDLTKLKPAVESRLREHRFNCMTTVAALGFGDIPPLAFNTALDLVQTGGVIAFNIKEDFIDECETSEFSKLIRELKVEGILRVECYQRYCHRLTTTGDKLYYVGMVAQKLTDLPAKYRGQ